MESVAVFENFFTLVFRPDEHRPSPRIPTYNSQMLDLTITLTAIQANLEKITINKSAGCDGINSPLLKTLIPVIAEHLALLCNLALKLSHSE